MAAPYAEQPAATTAPVSSASPDSLPAWAREKPTAGRRIDLVLRFIMALLVTPFFVAMSIAMRQLHVLLLVVVMLGIVTFLGTGGHVLDRYPLLGRIKLLGGALRVSHDMDAFYREHRPRGFLYYSVYPFYAFIGMIASKVVRREIGLHFKLVGIVLIMLVLEGAAGYGNAYPPYLGVREAAALVMVQLIVLLLASTMYLMPMMTTVYSLALGGHRKSLRGLLIGSLLLSIPLGYGTWVGTSEVVPWLDQMRFGSRMRKPLFQGDLHELTEMFLDHASEHDLIDADDARPRVHHKATERYRHLVRGLVLGAEHRAFDVIAFREHEPPKGKGKEKDPENGVWTGVRVVLGPRAFLLFLRSPSGEMFRRYRDLPEDIQKKFVAATLVQRSGPAERIAKRGLLIEVAPPE